MTINDKIILDLVGVCERALEALTCDAKDSGIDFHYCGRCVGYVDRNSVVREELRAAIARAKGEKP